MDPIRLIPKKFTKKFGSNVINRQYFCRKTVLKYTLRKSKFVANKHVITWYKDEKLQVAKKADTPL